jgi:kojibiose phosphorylase
VTEGTPFALTRCTAVISSRESRARDLPGEAAAIAQRARAVGYRGELERHRAVWRERWERAEAVLDGDPVRTNALRFCLAQLMQAAPAGDDRVGIGAKGLTGEWYRGHFFWDTELFMLPFFIYADPEVARNLVMYRWRGLEGARANARSNGYRGAMFPWEAALDGGEQTPKWIRPPEGGPRVRVWTGEREHHITADVAFGAWHYGAATGDEDLRLGPGAEILIEAARFWESRAAWSAERRRYDIKNVIGPDEFHEKVDNNAFTNALAAWTLRKAADLGDELLSERRRLSASAEVVTASVPVEPGEPRRWREQAARLYDPRRRNGVVEQHEGYFDLAPVSPELLAMEGPLIRCLSLKEINASQALKQADVLMLFSLFPDRRDRETAAKNWDYYEPRTAHDSSLSPSIHAVVAADLGLLERAAHYFDWACHLDLADRQGNTSQGLHAAALGGAWLAAVRGFGGLRLAHDGRLSIAPRVPQAWRGMQFRAAYRGGRLHVRAERRRVHLRYQHPDRSPASLLVYGRCAELQAGRWRSFAPSPDWS